MGPGARDGPRPCASIRNSSHLSGRGRRDKPDCGSGCAHASQRHQCSRCLASARAERSCASPANSAWAISSAQAASHPAREPRLPFARAVTAQARPGIKPAAAGTVCFRPGLASPHTCTISNLPPPELSAAELSAAELSAAELSAAELSAAELSAAELSAAELSAPELSAPEQPARKLTVGVPTPTLT
jgi:hypothetical protein